MTDFYIFVFRTMKKWILSVVIVVTNFLCAQSVAPVTGVPQFMGIPIEGDAVIFINKLKVKGFKVKKYDAIVTTMTGVFLGNVTNEVLIVHTPKSKKVWKVVVFLQEQIGWSSLKSEYQSLLSKLNNKYGEPSTSYFSFLSPYEEGDGYEMNAVEFEKTNIVAWWNLMYQDGTESGTIMLELSKWKQNKITWENATNGALKEKEQAELDAEEL
ncbi:MAG: hypothetical protein RL607_710 [Bacteroidota bacterium]